MNLNNELRERQRKAYEQLLKALEERSRECDNKNKSNSHDCFKNMFNITSEPIIINLKDILEMLKQENPKTQQEKTITEVEKEREYILPDDSGRCDIILDDYYKTNQESNSYIKQLDDVYQYFKDSMEKDAMKINISKNDSSETIGKKIKQVLNNCPNCNYDENTGVMTMYAENKEVEKVKQENKTLKQIDDERLSHKGKTCKVINHKQIIHGTEGIIVDVNLDLQKYLVSMGQDDEAFAQWFLFYNVEIIENKQEEIKEFKDIIVEGCDCENDFTYQIKITKDKAIAKTWNDDSWICGDYAFEFDLEESMDKNNLAYIRENYSHDNSDKDILIQEYLNKKVECLFLYEKQQKAYKEYKEAREKYNNKERYYSNTVLELIKIEEELFESEIPYSNNDGCEVWE